MKPGDEYPVHLQEWQVAQARVVSVEDGQVTLDIPATRVVMGLKTSLTDLAERTPEREQQVIGDGPGTRGEPQVSGSSVKPTQTQVTNGPAEPDYIDSAAGYQNQETEVSPETRAKLKSDDIGDGLANVVLPEME